MKKLKIINFWIIAFGYLFWNILRGNQWNMIYVDFDNGEGENGRQKRKQFIAKKNFSSYDIYWQDIGQFFREYRDAKEKENKG